MRFLGWLVELTADCISRLLPSRVRGIVVVVLTTLFFVTFMYVKNYPLISRFF